VFSRKPHATPATKAAVTSLAQVVSVTIYCPDGRARVSRHPPECGTYGDGMCIVLARLSHQ
jgi:hypothetical protein